MNALYCSQSNLGKLEMKSFRGCLTQLLWIETIISKSIAQAITLPILNDSLPISTLNGTGHDYLDYALKGTYGTQSLLATPLLMVVVSALADLAHEPYDGTLRGYHVPNLPDYMDNDISIQPVAPATGFATHDAILCLYYITYDMIVHKAFKNATFSLYWNSVGVVQISIQKRRKPTFIGGSNDTITQALVAQTKTLPDNSQDSSTNVSVVRFEHYYDYLPDSAGETMAPQQVFITVMATLKNLAEWPEYDLVTPFRSGAAGFDIRIQSLKLSEPRTELPFLRYGNLIEAIKDIPSYSLKHKKFGGMVIFVAYGKEIIGEAILEKGSPTLAGSNNNISIA